MTETEEGAESYVLEQCGATKIERAAERGRRKRCKEGEEDGEGLR